MNKDELLKKLEHLDENDFQEILKVRGELIKTLKTELKKEKDQAKKTALRLELYEELKKHKAHIKKFNESKESKTYSLPKRVGLKVKEIAATIGVFKEKHDIVGKVKKAAITTSVSSLLIGGITLGLGAVAGTLSIATISSLVPTLSYVCLANLIRNSLNKTEFSNVTYFNDNKEQIMNEIKEFTKEYITNNKQYINLLNQKRITTNNDEMISINENLVSEYKKILSAVPHESIGIQFKLELLNILRELKKMYSDKKDDYIHDKTKMSLSEFAELERKIIKLDIDLYKEENYLKDASKQMGENIKVSMVTMYLAKLLLSGVFPSLAFDSINDFITPFFITILNNLGNMDEIINSIKLRDSKYNEVKIKMSNPDILRDLMKQKSMGIS